LSGKPEKRTEQEFDLFAAVDERAHPEIAVAPRNFTVKLKKAKHAVWPQLGPLDPALAGPQVNGCDVAGEPTENGEVERTQVENAEEETPEVRKEDVDATPQEADDEAQQADDAQGKKKKKRAKKKKDSMDDNVENELSAGGGEQDSDQRDDPVDVIVKEALDLLPPKGDEKTRAQGLELLKTAATRGSVFACFKLAHFAKDSKDGAEEVRWNLMALKHVQFSSTRLDGDVEVPKSVLFSVAKTVEKAISNNPKLAEADPAALQELAPFFPVLEKAAASVKPTNGAVPNGKGSSRVCSLEGITQRRSRSALPDASEPLCAVREAFQQRSNGMWNS
jgi:hypothetical protein